MINTGIDEKNKNKMIALIHALAPEASIYLFGSRARGTHQKRSDIDIALEAEKPLSPYLIGEIMDVLAASNIHYTIQVLDSNDKTLSENMKKNIMQDRILLKEKTENMKL
jgi:predicted nucleotidyltransferase